jgi:N-acetylglucosamine-6-phosphate deacetylase
LLLRQLALTKATLLTPFNLIENATLLINEKTIEAAGPAASVQIPADYREVPLEGLIIAPGFIDLHLHGGNGAEVMSAIPSSLEEMAKFYATHGVTSFLATTLTANMDQLLAVARSFQFLNNSSYKGAKCLGLHLEGPYLSPKFAGMHNLTEVRPPSLDEILQIHRASNNGLKMITMAPELDGALEIAAELVKLGIICAIGHSDAGYEIGLKAMEAGFSSVTHCFNQLRPFHHRDPGILGAALTKPELAVELIADGVHLHPVVFDMVWRLKGAENIILVTDAMSPTGMPEGTYQSLNGDLIINAGAVRNEAGRLAGSILTLDEAIKNMLKFTECALTDVFRMVTYNPAKLLGINKHKGSLYSGKDADLVVLTTDLEVIMTMVGGEVISGLISID